MTSFDPRLAGSSRRPFHLEDRPRKERRAFNVPGHAHYLTFSCSHGLPLLNRDRTRLWLLETMDRARTSHQVDLYAYVIMPEHAHLLVRPQRDKYDISGFLYAVKRPLSFKAKRFLQQQGEAEWLARLTTQCGSQGRFHFWQPGGGYDRNLTRTSSLRPVIEYIHNNPVRRGFVARPTDWPWSSARYWADSSEGPLNMDQLPS